MVWCLFRSVLLPDWNLSTVIRWICTMWSSVHWTFMVPRGWILMQSFSNSSFSLPLKCLNNYQMECRENVYRHLWWPPEDGDGFNSSSEIFWRWLNFSPRARPLISVALSEMTRLTDLLPRNMTQAFMSATRWIRTTLVTPSQRVNTDCISKGNVLTCSNQVAKKWMGSIISAQRLRVRAR